MNGFILSGRFLSLSTWPKILAYECRFDRSKYSDTLWKRYNIPLHNSVKNAGIRRKAEFLAGRYACKMALGAFGIFDIEIGIGHHRRPLWPDGLTGSISHIDQVAMCALAKDSDIHSIGIDMENLILAELMEEIATLVFSKSELDYLHKLKMPVTHAATIAFSAKESLFKASHCLVGQYMDFNAATLVSLTHYGNSGQFVLRCRPDIFTKLLNQLEITGDYILRNGAVTTAIVINNKQVSRRALVE